METSYEIVIGLEVHAQLLTKSKLFCGDSIAFGAEPNTQISPLTLAHPGTLPKLNKKAVEFAVKLGLACHCNIETNNYFARKNYFYPDLPKGYQISQHTTPICKGGYIQIETDGVQKRIRLNRIHLEEDAGKSLHDQDTEHTSLDLNRAGTPLVEMVTEPDLRSADEAFAYLTEVRKLVRYLGVCDGNMEEGSLRCDANISVRKKGDIVLGTKVEIKNLNSIRNVKKAIEFEAKRLIKLLDSNNEVTQQTRSFDAGNGVTFATRDKEDADDYRYFPDPDLPAFHLTKEFIDRMQKTIPVLAAERIRNYTLDYKLPNYDAQLLSEERSFAEYFENITKHTTNYKAVSNWMLGPVKTWMNENGKDIQSFPLTPEKIAELINLTDDGSINFSNASTKIFDQLLKDTNADPKTIAISLDLIRDSSQLSIEPMIEMVLEKNATKVLEYKKGKKGLLSLFVGEVIKASKGKADPKLVNELLLKKLSS
jgi:aspartyl-tRNA(Asn)/glutamyl-tRNA(Gln) amidotransferase subunit B